MDGMLVGVVSIAIVMGATEHNSAHFSALTDTRETYNFCG